jgi:death on curing protein
MIRYLTAKDVLTIHYMIMELYGEGEEAGILFEDRFYSAIQRLQMISFGVEIHPTLWQKAGALIQSLIQEHPFYNGNKRTALACLNVFLEINGFVLTMPYKKAEEFIVKIATNEVFKGNNGPVKIGEIIQLNSSRYKNN